MADRNVTEFETTYFGLSDLERDALLDLYADHAYKFAERHGLPTPLVASRSFPTEQAWETGASPAQDAHTPRGATNTPPGGTESGEGGGGAQERPLGDRLRALGIRLRDAASNPDPANDENIELSGYAYWVMSQGIEELANQADRGRAAHQADVENLGRANVALVGQVDRVRALADDIEAEEDERWSFRTASRIRDALDGASSKAGGTGESAVRHG